MEKINVLGVETDLDLDDFSPVDIEGAQHRIDRFILDNPGWDVDQGAKKFGLERVVIEILNNGIEKVVYNAYGHAFIGPLYE